MKLGNEAAKVYPITILYFAQGRGLRRDNFFVFDRAHRAMNKNSLALGRV